MGMGAFFTQSGRDVILRVTGERRTCTLDEATAWEKDGLGRYKTANFVDPDGIDDLRVIVLDKDGAFGRYCPLSDVWEECDPDQCKEEGRW